MIKEHDCVVLTENLPSDRLEVGDVGTVIHVHQEGAAFEVEFMTLDGHTVAISTVLEGQLRPVSRHDIVHARELQKL